MLEEREQGAVSVADLSVRRPGDSVAAVIGRLYLRYDQTLRVGVAFSLFFTGVNQLFQLLTEGWGKGMTALAAFVGAVVIFTFFSIMQKTSVFVIHLGGAVASEVGDRIQKFAERADEHSDGNLASVSYTLLQPQPSTTSAPSLPPSSPPPPPYTFTRIRR